MRNLTPKRERFINEYLIDLNAARAVVRAGYSAKGASSQGPRLLAIPEVAAAIRAGQERLARQAEVSREMVLRELARIAFADLRDVFSWGPDGVVLKDSAALTDDQAAAVSEISAAVGKDGGSVRLKRHDKVKALELLGKHLGMFADRVSHEGGLDINISIQGVEE